MYDCYIDLPATFKVHYLKRHFQGLHAGGLVSSQIRWQDYILWCQHSAMQRLLKILGIFARLGLRDKKTGFLKDLVLTQRHLQSLLQDRPDLTDLVTMLQARSPKSAPPHVDKVVT